MSRYPPATDYRGFRERSRSPPRFPDNPRRGSLAHPFDNRPPGPVRNATDLPRGPRSQFDGLPRQSISNAPGAPLGGRPNYSSLRDAPPLSTINRQYRDREFERPPPVPSPRERSPPRNFKDTREYPLRELDIPHARRGSREGPPSAGSNFSDIPPFAAVPVRGGFGRGRGRGDYDFRGGRAGRRHFEDREAFRRERSPPPPRWSRDQPRDERDPERREDRRFERREEERRPEWPDRERELDRSRREPPMSSRLETRRSDESIASAPAPPMAPQAIQIDPGRLAILQQAGEDTTVRRPHATPALAPPRNDKREQPETPSYLNGRAETTANRYKQRGSPTQAPPVPAFTLSFAPQGPAPPVNTATAPVKVLQNVTRTFNSGQPNEPTAREADREPDTRAGVQPEVKVPPPAPKADLMEPPPAAPRAPRALEGEGPPAGSRLHGVRSLETFPGPPHLAVPSSTHTDGFARPSPPGLRAISPANSVPALSTLSHQASPIMPASRYSDIAPPTGPRAARASPALAPVSPRPTYASPRSDAGAFQGFQASTRGQTPPPTAPSGPRNKSFSMSPKVANAIPTAPKGPRIPPTAPRAAISERLPPPPAARGVERSAPPPPWAPPTAPRGLQQRQHNTWRRPGQPIYNDKVIPAKRDFAGEERERRPSGGYPRPVNPSGQLEQTRGFSAKVEPQTYEPQSTIANRSSAPIHWRDRMDVGHEKTYQSDPSTGPDHAATAKQSFLGKPEEPIEEDISMAEAVEEVQSSSDEEVEDPQQGLALFQAKFERQKRLLESQLIDLSAREYRATTPLESIARLSCITDQDLQRARDSHEKSEDRSPTNTDGALVPPATHSSGTEEGQDLLTPKGEEDAAVDVHSTAGESSDNARTFRRPSPEIITLPYLIKESRSFHANTAMQETLQRQEKSKSGVIDALEQAATEEDNREEDVEHNFDVAYRRWREHCEDLDREAEKQEQLERQMSLEPRPELAGPMALPLNPLAEGRSRLHKFNSEYEFEQVLKQSEETARMEQEKYDREARKNQADMEKEASIPDQQHRESLERGIFIDTNRYRSPKSLTLVFSYEPQPDTFTENEQQIFIAAFKETPKKWGEIASLLPGRESKDCIHHYYANKWDGRFRDNRTKKLKAGGKRGRGGKAVRGRGAQAMADLAVNIEPAEKSESGRPKRAAAPTTFGEREIESKASLINPSPAKKLTVSAKQDGNGEPVTEKPVKRRKGVGDKPGRKVKGAQPLAALAAAPTASSPGRMMMQDVQMKVDIPTAQSLEEASLLAGFRAEQHVMPLTEANMFPQEDYVMQMMPLEDLSRAKARGQAASARSGPSSYWSVPEQTDFVKYIGYFGTDFAAIANHMGTKTQTMIKNHYTRQIAHGNQPELLRSAEQADRRREMGEEVGPPPTPTPIVKRKYDEPGPTVQRSIAPQGDAMDLDEPIVAHRPPQAKHASPPQYQAQPRFTTSAQATPVPAHRLMGSPAMAAPSPATAKSQTSAPRPSPHPLGPGLSYMPDSRPDSRAEIVTNAILRQNQSNSQTSVPRSQPQQQNAVPDRYILQLQLEQEKALRMQQDGIANDRLEHQRHQNLPRGSAQGSPANPPMQEPTEERKLVTDIRPRSSPRIMFGQSPYPRPQYTSALGATVNSPSLSMLNRPPPQPPQNKQDQRSTSVSTIPPMQPSAPPEPPKRSNFLMSILNDDPPESVPPKRDSLPSMQQRVASPAQPLSLPGKSAQTQPSTSDVQALRRETFGQPSVPQSHFHRPAFSQQGPPFVSIQPTSVKQEPPASHGVKQDWASLAQARQPHSRQPTPPPTLEREVRPYFSHRSSVLSALNQPGRAVPSPPPPPHGSLPHARNSSVTVQQAQAPPRDQRPSIPGQPGSALGSAVQAMHSSPYTPPASGNLFRPGMQPEARNHAHHSHNSSLSGGMPGMQNRASLREDAVRQDMQAQQAQREREAQAGLGRWRQDDMRFEEMRQDDMRRQEEMRRQDEMRREEMMRQNDMMRGGRRQEDLLRDEMIRRDQERHFLAHQQQQHQQAQHHHLQRQQQQEGEMRERDRRQQQEQYMSRPPPQQMPPSQQQQIMQPQPQPGFAASAPFPFDPRDRMTPSLRDQSAREAEAAMQQLRAQAGNEALYHEQREREREREVHVDREREREREREGLRRRQEEAMMFRRATPLQSLGQQGFRPSVPAPPQPQPPQSQGQGRDGRRG
ncbi:hypothetical protein LTR62_005230 [Meristemomyces frigidus]|uniref:SANT domain-containing protein n=1 Tax=Meristemomyces frigidus TaxID=1508187 RepID=A0AAN7YNN9_9PEZI|nr:hypothetical protein LTR62_005230 [Meristemomyces frigidus]